MDQVAADILTFWFGTTNMTEDIKKRDIWFKATPDFDSAVAVRFTENHKMAAAGEFSRLRNTAEECLALIIALDQFPRNLFRGSHEAFRSDEQARQTARYALAQAFDMTVSKEPRKFFYLPFVHSENIEDQDLAVERYSRFDDPKSLESATGHREAIRRFGRFPHRNQALGRPNTSEEQEYLKIPPTWGMTAAEAADREIMLADIETQTN